MAALVLLIPIGMAIFCVSWLIGSPIMALTNIIMGKFIRAGIWLCISLFILNLTCVLFLDEPWADFWPLYYFIAFLVGVAELTKLWFRLKKKGPDQQQEIAQVQVAPDGTALGGTIDLVKNAKGVYVTQHGGLSHCP